LPCDEKKLVLKIHPDAIQAMNEWFHEYVMTLQWHSSSAKFMIGTDILFVIYLVENKTDNERELCVHELLYEKLIDCCVPFVPYHATPDIPRFIWIGNSNVGNSACEPFFL